MSSVKTFLRRQQDVNHFPSSSSRANQNQNSPEIERPLSEYDNLTASTLQTHFPLADIKFRFDDLLSTTMSSSVSQNSTTVIYNNNNNNLQVHSYENVVDTVQMRNKRENDQQQVKMDQTDGNALNLHRPVMSEAKSSFFGLNNSQQDGNGDDLEQLIEECSNITIISTNVQYVNLCEDLNRIPNSNADKVSATSSASGSSSVTATPPSTSPVRDNNCRKNSEGSNRSKSPKFILPEISTASPSQAVYMSTTVPQNIKGQNIMGRHKPTRNSLRHSRLIVKNFQAASHSNFLNIKHAWLTKFILLLKILIGISLLTLSAWICLFANSTPLSQNPFWSGLTLILSSLLGLYLLSFRKTRSKMKTNFLVFLKMNASVIIVLSVFLTTLALIYATLHYISLTSDNKRCFPENIFVNSSSCICVFNEPKSDVILSKEVTKNTDETHLDSSGHIEIDGINVVHFRDLSCNELSTWTHILLTSMILNFIGLSLAVCYLTQFIFGCKRRKKRNYLSVRNGA